MPALSEAEAEMSEPWVVGICLDPGGNALFSERSLGCMVDQDHDYFHFHRLDTSTKELKGATVGTLRNICISECDHPKEYIAHFDWDDWSAPDRLSIQLAHIQKCGKLAVGFRDMLMYETIHDRVYFYQNPHPHYTLGTSLFYKREAWEKMKFPDATPEDPRWRRDLGYDNFEGMSSLRADGSPIMIQVIHGGNASARIIRGGNYFKEASEQQAKAVREILARA